MTWWGKYPSLKFLICAILGIFSYDLFPKSLTYFNWLLVSIVLLSIFAAFSKKTGIRFLIFPCTISLAYLLAYHADEKQKSTHYSKNEKFGKYIAQIVSSPERKTKTYKAIAKILALKNDSGWVKSTGEIILYFNHESNTIPQYGDYFLLRNQIREIEPPKNPFEFDYKTYQARKTIYGHQFLRENDFKKLGNKAPNIVLDIAKKASNYAHEVFNMHLKNSNRLAVADALISGQQGNLDFETKLAYTNTGSIHALSVSGMHVAILFSILNLIFIRALKLKANLAFAIIAFILILYAIYTGLSPSVCRATFMFLIIQIGIVLKKEHQAVNTLFLSALILLLAIPNWLFDVGFQLSYFAVLGILILHPIIQNAFTFKYKTVQWIWEISSVSLSAQIFTLPLTLYYFHQFPNYFLLANPIVSLLSTVLLPLGLLLVPLAKVPGLGFSIGKIFSFFIESLNQTLKLISELPGALWTGFDLEKTSAILLFALIFLGLKFIRTQNVRALYGIAAVCAFFTIKGFFNVHKANQQREITFHFIPKSWGISVINGRNATFISSDSIIKEPLVYQYHLKNYYDAHAIKNISYIGLNEQKNANIKIENTIIKRLSTGIEEKNNQKANFVLCANKTTPAYDENSEILLDGSYTKWQLEKLKNENLNLAKKIIVLYETGSKTYPLP
jgi:competence protein ComEC